MDRAVFYAALRRRDVTLLGPSLSQPQVDRIEAVLDGLEQRGVIRTQAAYILATACHESDRFRAMEEYASGRAYEGRADLGNTVAGDGARFKGRGLVQITGRRNYRDWSNRLGVDLVATPELAADLRHAVPILIDGMTLGTFTGQKLGQHVNATRTDYRNARRVVNGLDRADLLADHARAFSEALREAGYLAPAAEAAGPHPEPAASIAVRVVVLAILAALAGLLATITGAAA